MWKRVFQNCVPLDQGEYHIFETPLPPRCRGLSECSVSPENAFIYHEWTMLKKLKINVYDKLILGKYEGRGIIHIHNSF